MEDVDSDLFEGMAFEIYLKFLNSPEYRNNTNEYVAKQAVVAARDYVIVHNQFAKNGYKLPKSD